MANGLYGQLLPAAGVLTKLMASTPAVGVVRHVVIGVCNTSPDSAAFIHIAVSSAATAATVPPEAYKSAGRRLGPGDEYDRTIPLSVGENVWVKSDKGVVAFDARGYEGKAQ